MDNDIIVALIGLLGVMAGGIVTYFVTRKKSKAEITQVLTDAAVALIEPLQKRIEELETRVQSLESRNKSLWEYIEKLLAVIKKLSKQIRDMGGTPVVTPPDWDGDKGV